MRTRLTPIFVGSLFGPSPTACAHFDLQIRTRLTPFFILALFGPSPTASRIWLKKCTPAQETPKVPAKFSPDAQAENVWGPPGDHVETTWTRWGPRGDRVGATWAPRGDHVGGPRSPPHTPWLFARITHWLKPKPKPIMMSGRSRGTPSARQWGIINSTFSQSGVGPRWGSFLVVFTEPVWDLGLCRQLVSCHHCTRSGLCLGCVLSLCPQLV